MQDEINSQVVAMSVRAGKEGVKITETVLRDALRKYMQDKDKTYRGKQTVAKLMKQDVQLTNIEVTDQNIKSFERVAKKYNVDFALKKDKSTDPPRYMVFFKAKDVDVMNAAFKEYSTKQLNKSQRPSIRKKLNMSLDKSKHINKQKVRQKDRGQQR